MATVVETGYWVWVRREAEKINSDGCSRVTQAFKSTCFEHDLSYYYGRDPRTAYAAFLCGHPDPWSEAKPITRRDADKLKADRLQARGPVGVLFSTWRYVGIRIGGWKAWRAHRRREAEAEK